MSVEAIGIVVTALAAICLLCWPRSTDVDHGTTPGGTTSKRTGDR